MDQRFPTAVLLMTAVTYLGFAIWLGGWPFALLTAFGVEQSTPSMLTEIRAFYGGVECGIAIVMLILWKQGNLAASLLVGGVPLACSATGRCLGMMVDGYSSTHLIFAAFELIGFLCCAAGMKGIHSTRDSNRVQTL